LILDAVSRGVRDAVAEHRRAGQPMVAWQDGQIVWIAAEQLPTDNGTPPSSRPDAQP
jgi:hypothetical protein